MSDALKVISYGFGSILGLIVIAIIVFLFIQDVTQKKHPSCVTIPSLDTSDLFGKTGGIFPPDFFSGDRDEMPFNRATRTWVYKNAKNEGGIVGFGPPTICASPARSFSSMSLFRCWNASGCRPRRLSSATPFASIPSMRNP